MARLRASLAARSSSPRVAASTLSVTFSMPTSTSATCVRQGISSPRLRATKPSSSRLFSLEEFSERQAVMQWWLVRISPSGDTNDAEQPERRTEASRTRSSQAPSMLAPYCCFTFAVGKLS